MGNKHICYGDFVSDLINVWGFTENQATIVANSLDFTTVYECTNDYQFSNFGIGRKQTEPEWFITALEWSDSGCEDENYTAFVDYAREHRLIEFIQDYWEIGIVKVGFSDCKEYWKQVVKDNIECCFDDVKLSEKQIEDIVEQVINDDYLWEKIDETVNYYIGKEIEKWGGRNDITRLQIIR